MREEQEQRISWRWRDDAIDLGLSIRGEGPTVLMLPALSSISTRREMAPLQQRLAPRFRTVAIDWPGFGDLPRPAVDWTPQAYADFLAFVLSVLTPKPHAVIAAGHAAGYALAHGCDHPGAFERLVLLAPTWRGPLPTMMKGRRPWFDRSAPHVRRAGARPPALSAQRQPRGGALHGGGARLRRSRLARPRTPASRSSRSPAPAARATRRCASSPVRSIRLSSREEFLDRARRIGIAVLTVYGAQTPRGSRAEIEALAAIPGMSSLVLPLGKLSFYEEFPDAAAVAIAAFLAEGA